MALSDTRQPRPNQDAYQASEAIQVLKEKLASLVARIPAKDSNSVLSTARSEARSKFETLLQQKQGLRDKKNELMVKINEFKADMKKKDLETKNSRDKLGFRSIVDIDAQVSSLEMDLQRGQLKLIDEKKAVAEIATLKKARRTLETLNAKPADNLKAKIDALFVQFKAFDVEIKAIDPVLTEAKASLDSKSSELKTSFSSVNVLLDEKKGLQKELDSAKETKSALYTFFKESQDAWFTQEREIKQKQYEADKDKRAAEKDARMVAQAEEELEDADVAAYQMEISLCNALIKFFIQQSPKGAQVVPAESTASVKKSIEGSLPERATVLQRKEDRDDDFMVLGNKKTKNGKKASTANKPLKMDLLILEQLTQLSISIPKSTSESSTVIEALEKKKQYFLDHSSVKTAANKKAATEKVAKLRASIVVAAE